MRQLFTCLVIILLFIAYASLAFTAHHVAIPIPGEPPLGRSIFPGQYSLYHTGQALPLPAHGPSGSPVATTGIIPTRFQLPDPIA